MELGISLREEFEGGELHRIIMKLLLLLLLSSLAFLTALSPPLLIFYGVSAQSSAATCAKIAKGGLPTKCNLFICCVVFEYNVNAYADCYCSAFNKTDVLRHAFMCAFTLPQNLTSCFPPGIYIIHTYIHTYIIYIYIYVCVCVYMYVCICMYTY